MVIDKKNCDFLRSILLIYSLITLIRHCQMQELINFTIVVVCVQKLNEYFILVFTIFIPKYNFTCIRI